MVGFEKNIESLREAGVSVYAASVDPEDKSKEVADELSFPVAYGVDREIGETLGSWWDEKRDFIQPSEFVVNKKGRIVVSSYSDGPLARLDASDVVQLIKFITKS